MNVASASGVSLGRPHVIGALTLRDETRASRDCRRETGATTDDDHLLDPGRLKPREYQDGVEALLRQFRPAIVRYCRARLTRNRNRIRTGGLDEDDVAQEVCLALLSALLLLLLTRFLIWLIALILVRHN